MMKRTRRPCLALLGVALLAASAPAAAQETAPLASEWKSYCSAYLAAIDGSAEASDLDVTYCLGVTKGLLNGLRIGSQIGALSFGSRLAILHGLDPDEVFKQFQQQEPARLLGICSPASLTAPDYVRTVLGYLEGNPAALQRPIGEVFFEALEEAHPCR